MDTPKSKEEIRVNFIYETRGCNVTNLRLFCPFAIYKEEDDHFTLAVPKTWWSIFLEGLERRGKMDYLTLPSNVTVDHQREVIPYPDDDAMGEDVLKIFYIIYKAYLSIFDHDHSSIEPFLSPFCLFPIKGRLREDFVKLTRINFLKGSDGLTARVKDFLEDHPEVGIWIEKTRETLGLRKDAGLFIKTVRTSGKNDSPLRPLHTPEEVVARLTETKAFWREWTQDRPISLVMMKWDYALDSEREFRVFVAKKKVRAISQQKWFGKIEAFGDPWKSKDYEEIAKRFGEAILNGCTKELLDALPYEDCVLDLWIDEDWKMHLIETNPGQMWSSSGSSLFRAEDREIVEGLDGSDQVEIRFKL